MREQTKNGATTFLNGTINDSTTTVTVVDASLFSSSPQFRIIIDSEIMLVTGISGNNLTVTRATEGSNAAPHNDGSTVAQIITVEGTQRYLRDWTNPYFDDAVPMQLLDGTTTLTSSSFTNINFTNASKADSSQGSIVLSHDSQTATPDVAMIVKSAPTAPWTLTAGIIPGYFADANAEPSGGICVRENATGEIYRLSTMSTGDAHTDPISNRVLVTHQTSPSAAPTDLAIAGWTGAQINWLQIEDNNTNIIFRVSNDGVNFVQLFSEPRLTRLGALDEIGVSIDNTNNSFNSHVVLVAWDES